VSVLDGDKVFTSVWPNIVFYLGFGTILYLTLRYDTYNRVFS
jgi:hypothetical protein